MVTRADQRELGDLPNAEAAERKEELIDAHKQRLRDVDEAQREAPVTHAEVHYRRVQELFSARFESRPLWRARVMHKNHCGLVNGTVHCFRGRFG